MPIDLTWRVVLTYLLLGSFAGIGIYASIQWIVERINRWDCRREVRGRLQDIERRRVELTSVMSFGAKR